MGTETTQNIVRLDVKSINGSKAHHTYVSLFDFPAQVTSAELIGIEITCLELGWCTWAVEAKNKFT